MRKQFVYCKQWVPSLEYLCGCCFGTHLGVYLALIWNTHSLGYSFGWLLWNTHLGIVLGPWFGILTWVQFWVPGLGTGCDCIGALRGRRATRRTCCTCGTGTASRSRGISCVRETHRVRQTSRRSSSLYTCTPVEISFHVILKKYIHLL